MSLIGEINTLKMNVLPKWLYSFQNIPVPPPSNLFSYMKTLVTRFLEQLTHQVRSVTFVLADVLLHRRGCSTDEGDGRLCTEFAGGTSLEDTLKKKTIFLFLV